VTSVGHRRKLLSAIAALRAADALPDLTPPTAPTGSPSLSVPRLRGPRPALSTSETAPSWPSLSPA
jgi:hypothetical protein